MEKSPSEELVSLIREPGGKMKLLYDSSALLNTIRLRKQNAYILLKYSLILCLTKYEIRNAFWKEALLQKRIGFDETLETMMLLSRFWK